MNERERFIDWLLPDARAAAHSNPKWTELDPEVGALLHEVSCQSGVPLVWLADAAGLVVNGLAGLQCLWFLHGASGAIRDDRTKPQGQAKFQIDDFLDAASEAATKRAIEKAGHITEVQYGNYDWGAGTIVETRTNYREKTDGPWAEWVVSSTKTRTLKLGKWLRKFGASEELRHAFETRDMPLWNWKISADPLDVLTMSFRRPWTSCMRPPDFDQDTYKEAGEAQYGPLTDMAAGAAILFWYRPGASQPCGRVVLRPVLEAGSYDPTVLWPGARQYGCGPALNFDQFDALLGPVVEPLSMEVSEEPLCEAGQEGRALSRLVYSDVDNEFCGQSDEAYLQAYSDLGTAPWPEARYEGHEMRSVALRWRGELDTDIEVGEQYDIPVLVDSVTDSILENYGNIDLMLFLREGLGDLVGDELADMEEAKGTSEDIVSDVTAGVRRNIEQSVLESLTSEPTDVLIVPSAIDLTLAAQAGRLGDPVAKAVAELVDEKFAQIKPVPPLMPLAELGLEDVEIDLETDLWLVAVSRSNQTNGADWPDVLKTAALSQITFEPDAAFPWPWDASIWE
jgi:hypothetical protein